MGAIADFSSHHRNAQKSTAQVRRVGSSAKLSEAAKLPLAASVDFRSSAPASATTGTD
jgi:hypothetical protein